MSLSSKAADSIRHARRVLDIRFREMTTTADRKVNELYSRDLGAYEKYMTIFHERGNHAGPVYLGVASKVRINGDVFKRALEKMQLRQPMMRMSIQSRGEGSKRNFRFVEMSPPRVDFDLIESPNWQTVFEDEIQHKFDVKRGPLWRTRVVKETMSSIVTDSVFKYPYAIIFNFHHSILDANFTKFLMLNVFTFFAHDSLEPITSLPMLPAIDREINALLENQNIEKDIVNNTFYNQKGNAFVAKYSAEIVRSPMAPITTKLIHDVWDATETTSFIAAFRNNGATATGVVTAAGAIAMAELLNAGNQSTDTVIPVELPVNLMQFLPEPPPPPNMRVAVAPISIDVLVRRKHHDSNFWDLARRCSEQIKTEIKDGAPLKNFKIIADNIDKRPSSFCLGDDRGIRTTKLLLKVSNIGNLTFPTSYGTFNLQQLALMNGNQMDGPIFFICTVTMNGRLIVSMAYYTQITNKIVANKFYERFHEIVSSNLNHTQSSL